MEEHNLKSIIRRLTPVETSRLMGFQSDDYLDIEPGKTSDAPRYKACGNSWGVNSAEFVNARIEKSMRENGVVDNDRAITYASVCSGVEAHSQAVRNAAWNAQFFSEIEPFPCRVLATRYPHVPNLGDMTKLDAHGYDLDVFSGGTPCFTAGNMVLTESGYRPIETIRVGDRVMSHKGRLCTVSAIGSKMADNIVDVKCKTALRIRCTADHKFWTPVNPRTDFRRNSETYRKYLFDGMEFRRISDIGKGGFVSKLTNYEQIPLPEIPTTQDMDARAVLELAGWYVGDGHIGKHKTKNKKVLILSLNADKVGKFVARFNGSFKFGVLKHGDYGVFRIQICNTKLCEWLLVNFGSGSATKTIPAWLIAAEDETKQAFLDGYMATDGFTTDEYEFACSTTSLSLALGLYDLVGHCSMYKSNVPKTKKMYDGRIVNQSPFYNVRLASGGHRCQHDFQDWSIVRVANMTNCPPERVYNITVGGDHGYVVNGICVKNCQSVSVAGKRHGMAEGSGTRSSLAFHWLRISKEANAKVVLWENVCFAGDTLITMKDGHKRIDGVKVGDRVRSFDGKFHRVVRVMKTKGKKVIRLRVMGADEITVTPNHPFYARVGGYGGKRSDIPVFSVPEWIPAGELTEKHYIGYRLDPVGKKSIGLANAYAVGRWLADGCVALRNPVSHNGKRGGQRARIFISTGYKKRAALLAELLRLPYGIGESKVKDYAITFTFTSDAFYDLIKDCGRGARNKKIPAYAYELIPEEQKELLRGYLDGDGCLHRKKEMTYCSSSRELAIGIARLVRDVYHRGVSILRVKGAGKSEIDGRTVNAHDFWRCSFINQAITDGDRKHLVSFVEGGFVWCPVKSIVDDGESKDVYNLTVADTHTYEANDVVVHNCGAYSSNGGADFAWFVHRITEAGYGVAWRTLDVQYDFSYMSPRAIPQRRRRVWLVAVKDGNWQMAAQILFERAKFTGRVAPSRVLGDGTLVDEHGNGRNTFFTKDSRADWIPMSEFPKDFGDARRVLAKCGEIRYAGQQFVFDLFNNGEQTPDNFETSYLENIGAGAGLACGDCVYTLTMPEWTGGMQLPWGEKSCPDSFNGTVSGLSDILLPWGDYLGKYLLSKRACEGIVRRAEKRGKDLPKILQDALKEQIGNWTQGFLDKYLAKAGLIEGDCAEEDEEDGEGAESSTDGSDSEADCGDGGDCE